MPGIIDSVRLGLLTASLLAATSQIATADADIVVAAKAQDWPQVYQLLKSRRTDVDATQPDGATALAWAAHWDEVQAAKRLLKSGADPDIANDYGVAPLMLAIRNRSPGMVELLFAKGANPNATLWTGVTTLMVAARAGRKKGFDSPNV